MRAQIAARARVLSLLAVMYTQFFRLAQAPFSISPDPRYLFMSERHREALAHLLYGIDSGGGLVLLSGDIGTGKTTICRCVLEQVPAGCNIAYIFNPKLSVSELLQSVCEEFHIALPGGERASVKDYIDALNRYLLAAHAGHRNNVLIIDEAQNLSAEVLEQLRLLTNLETNERKLLQIILIGQPELRAMLSRPELEQLAQRVIAHYHLSALSEQETASYIQHRLATAGLRSASPFQQSLMKQIHRLTGGVPRRINLLCDRALLGAYAKGVRTVDREMVDIAAGELFIHQGMRPPARRRWRYAALALTAVAVAAGAAVWTMRDGALIKAVSAQAESPISAPVSISASEVSAAAAAGESAASVSTAAEKQGRPGLPNEKEAIRQLAAMWGLSLHDDDPCEAAQKAGVRCHRGNGGFAELRALDRPAVLKLQDAAGKTTHALLTRLDGGAATLRAGDAAQTISLLLLARSFHGEFVTLWRAPRNFSNTVQMGDRGPEVDWVTAQLAKLNGTPEPTPAQPFGPNTLVQVRQFQQVHGLFVDGKVGPMTVMLLNRAAGIDEPRLQARAAIME